MLAGPMNPPMTAMVPGTIGVQQPAANEPAMNAPPFDQSAQALRVNMQLMQRQLQQPPSSQSPWMQGLQPTQISNLAAATMQDSRLGQGVGSATSMGQIPPQAQAQHRLLASGIGIGGGGGGANLMMGGGFQNNGPGGTLGIARNFPFQMGGTAMGATAPGGMGFGGGVMPGIGGPQSGILPSGGMSGITPEMMRAFQQSGFSGQGNV